MRARCLALALGLAGGCHAAEPPGPPWDPPPRAVIDLGCVHLAPALLTEALGKVPGIPLAISFHSDCKERARLDLGRVRVTARLADGSFLPLVPFDPRHELRAGLLAPGDTSNESIEYDAGEGTLAGWTHVCVGFDEVRPDRRPRGEPPICFTPQARLVEPEVVDPEIVEPAVVADGGAR